MSSDADVIRSTLLRSCSPEVDVIRGSEDHQKLEDLKLQSLSNAVSITPIIAEE